VKKAETLEATEATTEGRVVPSDIEKGLCHAYFIFDIADTIDLTKLTSVAGQDPQRAQLQLRAVSSPGQIEFAVPPIITSLPDATIDGMKAKAQIKLYDYGTVAFRFSVSFHGCWSDFSELARKMRQSESFVNEASKMLRELSPELSRGLTKPHDPLMEDYFVFEVEQFNERTNANQLLGQYKAAVASLILGESQSVSLSEQDEALRINFSYFEDDLTVVHWDTAFVYDTREGAEAVESILEFANTQLVELRTYDTQLDAHLDEIYKLKLPKTNVPFFFGKHKVEQRAEHLRYLLMDIRELTERASNALKIIGSAFYARLYRAVAMRLGLPDWEQQIDSKLNTIAEIYRYAADEAQETRALILELTVIVLILIEVVIGLLSLHH
jgi:hypothetical protein